MAEDHVYTFIAYKPDSDDTCMGCHMASYSSDLIFECEIESEERVIEIWAGVLATPLDTGEEGYEDPKILRDGWRIPHWDDNYDRIYRAARAKADLMIEDRKARAQKAKEAEQQKAAEEREARERSELKRLQKKYGDEKEA